MRKEEPPRPPTPSTNLETGVEVGYDIRFRFEGFLVRPGEKGERPVTGLLQINKEERRFR